MASKGIVRLENIKAKKISLDAVGTLSHETICRPECSLLTCNLMLMP